MIFASRYQFWLYFNSITFHPFLFRHAKYLYIESIRDRYCRLHNYDMIARHNSSDGLIFHMNWWAENTMKTHENFTSLTLFLSFPVSQSVRKCLDIIIFFFSALVRVFYLICEWKCVQWLQTAETNSENCRLYLCAPCALFFILLHKTNLQLPQLPWMITFQSNDNNAMESGTTNDMKKKS